ncbi:hypothetical protein H6G76_04795 [Nostoc sp. FACHB-152]|uniref:hypothetical protein n=1 Tax=unclassified Nostoc TaxID=2593658 RepID=UPI001685E677|nr:MULTISPECIES: hypothetical protein [unclassified Nostoc]MBD2446486.1 hypothetical protein [Nostoc sp. FACHB-152]
MWESQGHNFDVWLKITCPDSVNSWETSVIRKRHKNSQSTTIFSSAFTIKQTTA